jgi:hypothetical protein
VSFKTVVLCFLFSTSVLAEDSYHLVKKIPIPGQGGFDYLAVDEETRRLYVSHGIQVEVLDVDSGAIVGKIPNTLGVHGIAIVPEFGRGCISDGKTSTVTIFDLKTLKAIAEVPTGKKPDAIVYDAATKQVLVFNGGGDSTTVISAADGKVTATLDLGWWPGIRGRGLAMENARLSLAVILFPSLNQNFTTVDDVNLAPQLPSFQEARALAAKGCSLRICQCDC